MQFVVTATDVDVVAVGGDNYTHVNDVKCPKCPMIYQLWAPILETEASEVQAQTEWLTKHMAKTCPKHDADKFLTPDRPR